VLASDKGGDVAGEGLALKIAKQKCRSAGFSRKLPETCNYLVFSDLELDLVGLPASVTVGNGCSCKRH
jgi:hypothetical protein